MFTFNYKRIFGRTWLSDFGEISADAIADAQDQILTKFDIKEPDPTQWTAKTEFKVTIYTFQHGDQTIEIYKEPSLFDSV